VLQIDALKPIQEVEKVPRWPYKKHAFPNGAESYWIKWKLYPDDARFFSAPKKMIIQDTITVLIKKMKM